MPEDADGEVYARAEISLALKGLVEVRKIDCSWSLFWLPQNESRIAAFRASNAFNVLSLVLGSEETRTRYMCGGRRSMVEDALGGDSSASSSGLSAPPSSLTVVAEIVEERVGWFRRRGWCGLSGEERSLVETADESCEPSSVNACKGEGLGMLVAASAADSDDCSAFRNVLFLGVVRTAGELMRNELVARMLKGAFISSYLADTPSVSLNPC